MSDNTPKEPFAFNLLQLFVCGIIVVALVAGWQRYDDWRLSQLGPADWPDVVIRRAAFRSDIVYVQDYDRFSVIPDIRIAVTKYTSTDALARAIRKAAVRTQRRIDAGRRQKQMVHQAIREATDED